MPFAFLEIFSKKTKKGLDIRLVVGYTEHIATAGFFLIQL